MTGCFGFNNSPAGSYSYCRIDGAKSVCQPNGMRKLVALVFLGCVVWPVHGETLFPSGKGTLWKYQMTQEFGEGVRPSSGADQLGADGKLRLPVDVFAAGAEKIDGVDTVKYELHRLSVVSQVEYLAVSDKGVTAYTRADEEGERYKLNPTQRVLNFPVRAGEKWN